jgi:prolyl-tRNA synthetase
VRRPLADPQDGGIGHIFKLGYKYSESMGLRVNAEGKEVTPIMGSYGIGIERILCAAIELYHDKDGMILPLSIAPFQVVVTPANISDAAQAAAARRRSIRDASLGLDAYAGRSRRAAGREIQGR